MQIPQRILIPRPKRRICTAVLRLLHDKSNDVQAVAVKTLGVLLQTVPQELVLEIGDSLTDQVLDAGKIVRTHEWISTDSQFPPRVELSESDSDLSESDSDFPESDSDLFFMMVKKNRLLRATRAFSFFSLQNTQSASSSNYYTEKDEEYNGSNYRSAV